MLVFLLVVEQAKVVFDYDADNDDELTIKVGEVVDIISKDVDQDGWWEVHSGDGGREGRRVMGGWGGGREGELWVAGGREGRRVMGGCEGRVRGEKC